LEKNQKWCYPKEVLVNHSFLKYPIFVKDRPSFLEKAESAKIQLGDWFLSPIHPIENNFSLWALDENAFPIGLEKSAHILNLPTDSKNCEKVIRFLQRNLDDLI
jgi:hypothetical protein